jgi:uncharacterized protein YcfL
MNDTIRTLTATALLTLVLASTGCGSPAETVTSHRAEPTAVTSTSAPTAGVLTPSLLP